MKLKIDYPAEKEIERQKAMIMERAFPEPIRRPPPRIVFFQCGLTAVISLAVYFCLMLVCAFIHPENISGGFIALAVFPLTYFSFYFLSVLSEEQSEVIELKRSLRYSFGYLVSLRMLYASLATVGLNLVMLLLLFREINNFWSIGAAGTTAMLMLSLASLVTYEKTNSAKPSAVILSAWTVLCVILSEHGEPLYHLLIEVIPLAVHICAAFVELVAFICYVGKVEKRNAYGF